MVLALGVIRVLTDMLSNALKYVMGSNKRLFNSIPLNQRPDSTYSTRAIDLPSNLSTANSSRVVGSEIILDPYISHYPKGDELPMLYWYSGIV